MVGNRLPQIIKLARYPGADGVSVGAWSLGVLCSSTWMVYYVGFHLWSACTATASSGAANVTVALLANWRHRQGREDMIREVVFAVKFRITRRVSENYAFRRSAKNVSTCSSATRVGDPSRSPKSWVNTEWACVE